MVYYLVDAKGNLLTPKTLNDSKIKVESPEQSETIQKLAITLGFFWRDCGTHPFRFTNAPYLCMRDSNLFYGMEVENFDKEYSYKEIFLVSEEELKARSIENSSQQPVKERKTIRRSTEFKKKLSESGEILDREMGIESLINSGVFVEVQDEPEDLRWAKRNELILAKRRLLELGYQFVDGHWITNEEFEELQGLKLFNAVDGGEWSSCSKEVQAVYIKVAKVNGLGK